MPLSVKTVIRDAHPADHIGCVTVLADAFSDGAVAAWAEPHPIPRLEGLLDYFTLLVAHAATNGLIQVATTEHTVAGVAVWYPRPAPVGGIDVHDLAPTSGDDPAAAEAEGRLARLEQALKDRHPVAPHQYLAYLAASPPAQNRGIGTALLRHQHAVLDRTAAPAYLEANDTRNRALYARLGYTGLGAPVTVHGGPPVWPMWRHPHPAPAPNESGTPR
jgi:GNAT superfamily N-acetyltransferase